MVLGRPAAHIDTDLGDQPVEDVLACVIVLLRPALVPACLRWATPRDGPWAPVACRPGTRHTERRGTKTRTKESRNVRRHSASEWACSRPSRAALPEGTLERMCKPAGGDTNGGLTAGVTREGPVSFVPHVVPHPPVEQLGLLDLARGCRRESSVLGDCSASPRTPVPPAVLRKHGCPLPNWPAWSGPGARHARCGASHAIRVPRVRILPSASFRSHLTMGTLAVRLGVPVIKASKGLAPSSHFRVGFRLPVDSARQCTAPGFLDSGLTVFASTLPRPARRGRVAPGRGFDSRISPASTVRCMSA